MAWRRMTERLPLGVVFVLGMAALNIMTQPPVAVADPRSAGLPRLEFETPPGLSLQAASERPRTAPVDPRGAMGYRLPLVSRQKVPAQVVSGVLIPAHTTYVILRPGYWERVGSTEGEAVSAIANAEADDPPAQSKSGIRGWSIWRLFRRSGER